MRDLSVGSRGPMTAAAPLVSLQDLSVRLGAQDVLHAVSLDIEPGEIVTIVGPNGSGKSTLLRTILGAVQPRSGRVQQRQGLKVGYVPQKLHVDPTMPVSVARFLGLPRRRSHEEVAQALQHAGLPDLHDRPLSVLSGGQFQRVLLARAILDDPDLLLLDEPTQGLDQPGSAAFYRQIEALRDELGCAVVMVSHELHVVMSASDRVICLNGHICCSGTPEIVASAPEYRALFGTGTGGALAIYRHDHDHSHDAGASPHDHAHHQHDHGPHSTADAP